MGLFDRKPLTIPSPADALPGRDAPLAVRGTHVVNGHPTVPPFPAGLHRAVVALGCFWGAERKLWQQPGVYTTYVGYAGGHTANPTYREVCSGRTGHTEVVVAWFDPALVTYEQLVRLFFESHDPTQGMRQGNDVGTQYRSAIYTDNDAQLSAARAVRDAYQQALAVAGHHALITTEIALAGPVYYAEDEHQQYLAKNPNGYCGIGGVGVSCPVGIAAS